MIIDTQTRQMVAGGANVTQDRIGTALMLMAAAWLTMLAFTEPGNTASTYFRVLLCLTASAIVIVAFFPKHLFLTGTVLIFTVLGLALHIGAFGIFGIGLKGLLPAILLVPAMYLRRDRLDGDPIVVITAAVACGLAIAQPQVVLFAFTVIAAVNIVIWLLKSVSSLRTSR